MNYILILITCVMFMCTNLLDPPNTTLEVSAGDDIAVTINDTISLSGTYTSSATVEKFNWYITGGTTRLLVANTQLFQYIAPDSVCTLSFIFQAITANNTVDEDTVIAYIVPDTVLTVNAGQDQTVLAYYPVVLRATYTGDNIIGSFWKIGSNSFIPASPETSFVAPSTQLLIPCIFKVKTSDNREAADTVTINVITLDSMGVVAKAGNDTSVVAGSQLTLHGAYIGKNITQTYWNIAGTAFIPASLDTTITLPDTPTTIPCVLKVTKASLEALDTVMVTVRSKIPLSARAFEDTSVLAGSTLKINGSYTGDVVRTFWKIGNGTFIPASPETTITVPDTATSLMCIFKVQDLQLKEAVDTAIITVIDTSSVHAHVGNDTTVTVNTQLRIHGSFIGKVIGTYWKIGGNDFIPASAETTITVPSTPLLLPCIFKVVGANSAADQDTIHVNVVLLTDTAEASAGNDTIVPVNTQVQLHGSYTGSNVVGTYWNINNNGFISSLPESTILAPASPAVWMCIFKIVTSDQKEDQDTMYLKIVPTTLYADAGDDQFVTFDSTVQLTGTGKDTLNPDNAIVKYEWKYGNGLWIESTDGKGIYNPPAIPGPVICSLRVTAKDNQTAADFCIINVLSTIEMVVIPSKGQTFLMGKRLSNQSSPVHNVTFTKNFLMSKTEITQKEFVSMVDMNPSPLKNNNYPVHNCNWFDAVFYCNARSKFEGRDTVYSYSSVSGTIGYGCSMEDVKIDYTKKGYRLPTEAEWEFACRGGTTTDFYWGNIFDNRYFWYLGNSQSKPSVVAGKSPNGYGLFDMSGNVKEWCNDWYAPYTLEDKVDPTGPDSSPVLDNRVVRNGSYLDTANQSASYKRDYLEPHTVDIKTGFRIVLEQ